MKKAVIAEFLTILLWALGNIFITYLSLFFDNYTQNFFRYISAAIFFLLISLTFNSKKYLISLRNIKKLLFPSVVVFIFQIFNVYGISWTTPTIATLITRLSIFFVDIFSFFIFPEERATIKNKNFVLGTIISFIGVVGVVSSGKSLFYSGNLFFLGVIFLVITSVLWAVYIIAVKISLSSIDPISATANIFLISGAMYLPFSIASGGFYEIFKVDQIIIFYLVASGILSIGIGNFLNYYAINELGASFSTNLQILIPVFTGIFSIIVFNEPMPLEKVAFSALTLVGCWLIIRASNKSKE